MHQITLLLVVKICKTNLLISALILILLILLSEPRDITTQMPVNKAIKHTYCDVSASSCKSRNLTQTLPSTPGSFSNQLVPVEIKLL